MNTQADPSGGLIIVSYAAKEAHHIFTNPAEN
jgi:hypothetical protein